MLDTKDEQNSQSAASTPSVWWNGEVKPVTVVEPKNTVKQLERALSFILSSGQFDEFQQFCFHLTEKGSTV